MCLVSSYKYIHISVLGCTTEESGKLLEICIPCWICTRCDHLQRKFRSLFHGISVDRRNEQLNTALLRISAQLGQETCQLRVGGLIKINNEMLGKVIATHVIETYLVFIKDMLFSVPIRRGELYFYLCTVSDYIQFKGLRGRK